MLGNSRTLSLLLKSVELTHCGVQTGLTDIPLTEHGESIVRDLGTRIVGANKILDPAHIQHVFVSPRQRAVKTFDLLFEGVEQKPSWSKEDEIREWEYGVCEGALLGRYFPLPAR